MHGEWRGKVAITVNEGEISADGFQTDGPGSSNFLRPRQEIRWLPVQARRGEPNGITLFIYDVIKHSQRHIIHFYSPEPWAPRSHHRPPTPKPELPEKPLPAGAGAMGDVDKFKRVLHVCAWGCGLPRDHYNQRFIDEHVRRHERQDERAAAEAAAAAAAAAANGEPAEAPARRRRGRRGRRGGAGR
jgi:hypothetical protein